MAKKACGPANTRRKNKKKHSLFTTACCAIEVCDKGLEEFAKTIALNANLKGGGAQSGALVADMVALTNFVRSFLTTDQCRELALGLNKVAEK